MFLALRELSFARGRFALMGTVVALVAVLMVLLSGLSVGLVNDGVSGLKKAPATHFAFVEDVDTSSAFSRSVVTDDAYEAWQGEGGVEDVARFGNTLVNGRTDADVEIDLALFGVDAGSFMDPDVAQGEGLADHPRGVVVSETALDEGVELGDTVTVDQLGTELEVVGVLDGQHTFGHIDVGYVGMEVWQEIASGTRPDETVPEHARHEFTAVALLGDDLDPAAGDRAAGTTTLTREASFDASPGYSAETMTLDMIRWFLYAIAALVVGAFFTVVTIQRRGEIAVMRAMGASKGYLVRDSLAQSFLLLLASVAVGVAAGTGFGAFLSSTPMPFHLEAADVLVASALVVVLGMVGAVVAVLRITRVDPLSALGGNR